ncbi:MAG TPA: extracellular solute-binding protein [Candidatus Binatia bacterium]|jgi:iron(III) transport system substrate-binding protein|nr:extracellular solute-binding protein [Candidatus Binatia bacterium]
MNSQQFSLFLVSLAVVLILPASHLSAAESQGEWESTLAAARKEGKVVVGIPPSAELRKQMEATFKSRFGIEAELFSAPGPQIASRIVSESKAGARYFDAFIFGSCTGVPLIRSGLFEAIEPYMMLSEVKDPKHWWGGHIWMDNASTKRFFYSFVATKSTEGLWHNATLVKPEEVRSFDDLLDPKWKGKIGFSDPRVAGSGLSVWSFLWDVKGEGYLTKLVQQGLFLSQNLRQIADALAKERLALALGIGYAQTEPFMKAGIPLKELPEPREGLPASNGYGTLGIVKNPPHPNATKVFVSWLLSKEGQELYSKVLLHGTRRLDVDTKWMVKEGAEAAKDFLTVKEYDRLRNHLEDKCVEIRMPSQKFAEKILQ